MPDWRSKKEGGQVSRFPLSSPAQGKRLRDVHFQDIAKWTEERFKRRLLDAVMQMAGDKPEVRIWLKANWTQLYQDFLASGKTFEDWFNVQAFF